MRKFALVVAALGVFAIIALPVNARKLENWSYERLFKDADIVVIARAGSTSDTKDRYSKKGWKVEFIGQDTQFVAQTILKGKLGGDKKLMVLHYRLPEGVQIENGPLLVRFRKDSVMLQGTINGVAFKAAMGPPEYMLFLRLRKDGRYEPVSGEIDPSLSVRELNEADGFFADMGKK